MRLRLFLILAGLTVVALVLLLSQRPAAPPTEPTTKAAAPAPNIKTTGVYADDWQSNCGPLAAAAQEQCTAALDKAYGKSDAAPVPAPAKGR